MLGLKLGLVVGALAPVTTALLVAPGSPCASQCGNVLSSDSGSDMVCHESNYGSSAGIVFENCVNCLLTSTYSSNNVPDTKWLLYNLRYAASWCIFGYPNNTAAGSSPCMTQFGCGNIQNSIEYNNLSTVGGTYDFCSNWTSNSASRCETCLRPNGDNYLANFIVVMDAACQQQPGNGTLVSISGNPFSTTAVQITTAVATASVATTDYGPVGLGARVGIAFGGLAFILALAGFCIVMNGKRRRRRFLRELEKQHADSAGWPHPTTRFAGLNNGQQEMFETPVSQKPLRGWDESPVSAHTDHTERTLPRYFSPYNSQYTSPVSAGASGPSQVAWPSLVPQQQHLQEHQYPDVPPPPPHPPLNGGGMPWPTTEQEKMMMQASLDHQRRQHDIAIGIALGGDEASLRSKRSNQGLGHFEGDLKGKEKEAYEMHEVESPYSGGSKAPEYKMPAEPAAPVLHHPGYGRQPSAKSSRSASASGRSQRSGNGDRKDGDYI